MIDSIISFFKALNSDTGPWSIAFGLSLGMFLGLTPLWSFHNLIILLIAFIFRTHLASFGLSAIVFTGFAYLFDQPMIAVGESLLTDSSLVPLWTDLYQSDFWRTTRFNNTMVLGSLTTSLILFIPFTVIFKIIVVRYRQHILSYVSKLRIVEVLKASRLFTMFSKVSN